MARDRSLDEFLGGGSDDAEEPEPQEDDSPESRESGGSEDGSDEESEGDTEDSGAEVEDGSGVESVEPAAVEATMAFAPDGADCAACGATVERRWQGESGLVCADCKEW